MTGEAANGRRRAGDNAFAELVAAIGGDAARRLAERFGGTALYVPRAIGDHHPISVALGRADADRLAAWAGGGTVAIPKQAVRRAQVRELRNNSRLTIAQIALQTSFSERHVYRLLGEDEPDDRQPSLFGE